MRAGDVAVAGIAGALFVVPAAVLVLADPPARFGFQMYSGYGVATATWTDASGTTHDVDLADHLASPRRDVDWTTVLPRPLCARIHDAVEVEVRQTARGGDRVGTATC